MTYPVAVWDGLTSHRLRADDVLAPDDRDYDKCVAELISVETELLSLLDANRNVTLNPLVTKGTDPSYTTIADLFTITTKDLIVAVGSSAVASKTTGYTIPANSLVLGVALNIESTITLATATKVGVGVAATLDKYGKVTGGTKNNKATAVFTPTAVAATEPLLVYAVDNSGAAAGTIQNGSIRIRIIFATQAALPDAA